MSEPGLAKRSLAASGEVGWLMGAVASSSSEFSGVARHRAGSLETFQPGLHLVQCRDSDRSVNRLHAPARPRTNGPVGRGVMLSLGILPDVINRDARQDAQ